jgi:hypothetical protein
MDCLLWPNPQLPKQPDCWIQITVPNEFQPVGKFNIGMTAGIETTICAPQWIDGINRMDLTLSIFRIMLKKYLKIVNLKKKIIKQAK